LHDGRRAFWIIKHGIKMSAMPAWSKALDDEAIWDVVSFVRRMPDMTPETYRELTDIRAPDRGSSAAASLPSRPSGDQRD
jgi:mono/diheme cytochrome c family protein